MSTRCHILFTDGDASLLTYKHCNGYPKEITDGGQVGNANSDERCASCGSNEGIDWVVQSGTPAGNYLRLADGETTELCDECMREVAGSIGDCDESFQNESTKGGENER